MSGTQRLILMSTQKLRAASDAIKDDDVPVTAARLCRKLRVPASSMSHLLNSYAPWLKEELSVQTGFRGDDRSLERAYRGAAERLKRRYGCVAYFMLAEELGIPVGRVKEYIRTHPRLKKSLRCIGAWEARYIMVASVIPETERTVARFADTFRSRFGIGNSDRVRQYLKSHPNVACRIALRDA